MICPSYDGLEMEVLYEDSKCIILNKSPGIHSHPLKYNERDNCLSFLRKRGYFEALKVNLVPILEVFKRSVGILLALFFGYIFFKEQINMKKIFSVLIILVGLSFIL